MKMLVLKMVLILGLVTSAFANLSTSNDGEYLTISGTVKSVDGESFKMATKNRMVEVETDDYSWKADGYKLKAGEKVIVTGRVDHDFFETKKIDAGSVYVKSMNAYFYSNSSDDDIPYLSSSVYTMSELPDNVSVDLQGKVISVDDRTFTLNTGIRKVEIDTDKLAYNPMDKVGFTKVKVGDRVRVSGVVDDNFFTEKQVDANFVMTLGDQKMNSKKMSE